MLNRLLILFFIMILASCTDNRQKRKEIVAEKIVMINENRTELEKLTLDILDDPFVNQQLGKFISPSDLSDNLKERLLRQGIIRLSVHKQDYCSEVVYATDWTEYPIGKLSLKWTTCDSVQTRKGYYLDNFNTNFIEAWGVGNNWSIWIDSDYM